MHPKPTTVPWSAQLATPHPLPSRHMRRVSKLMGSHPRSRDLLSSSPSCPCILLFLFLLISFVWVETCGEVFRNDLTPSFQSLPRTFLACRINLFFYWFPFSFSEEVLFAWLQFPALLGILYRTILTEQSWQFHEGPHYLTIDIRQWKVDGKWETAWSRLKECTLTDVQWQAIGWQSAV